MPQIPQRELRNDVSSVLRRAEQGEHFVITVDGRPVAELGPLVAARRPASAASLHRVLATSPVDRDWPDELRRGRAEDAADAADPWSG